MNNRQVLRIITGVSALFALTAFNAVVIFHGSLAIATNLLFGIVVALQYIFLFLGGDDEVSWHEYLSLSILSLAGLSFALRGKLLFYLSILFIVKTVIAWLKSGPRRFVVMLLQGMSALVSSACFVLLQIGVGIIPVLAASGILCAFQVSLIALRNSTPQKKGK